MMPFTFSVRSSENLATVHPRLQAVVRRALELTNVDFKVIEGVRTEHRQHQLYGQGRTAAQLSKVGVAPSLARPGLPQVTWTLKSKHFRNPVDGYGRAVDLLPAPYDWKDLKPFDQVAEAMFQAAGELGEEIRWGADFDQDGKIRERGESDSPHFEIVL